MRCPRVKSPEYKYHIRVRGLDEIPLFRDDNDKEKYLLILDRYRKIFGFVIYSICIMSSHAHMFMDPKGQDISVIMHRVNLCYSKYYNKKYSRGGPVFRGRFESDPVCTESYSIALSAYIHNNPKDIIGFRGREEFFYYSSYGIYAGIRKNGWEFLDTDYILGLMRCSNINEAIDKYLKLVKERRVIKSMRNIVDCLDSGRFNISGFIDSNDNLVHDNWHNI